MLGRQLEGKNLKEARYQSIILTTIFFRVLPPVGLRVSLPKRSTANSLKTAMRSFLTMAQLSLLVCSMFRFALETNLRSQFVSSVEGEISICEKIALKHCCSTLCCPSAKVFGNSRDGSSSSRVRHAGNKGVTRIIGKVRRRRILRPPFLVSLLPRSWYVVVQLVIALALSELER